MADGAPHVLPAALRLGPVRLAVTDLDRAEPFYRDVLGLALATAGRADDGARTLTLGDGDAEIVTLVEEPGAGPARRGPGLYHVALLFPSRSELARVGMRIAVSRTPIQGTSDHGTHEAIYLADPDGNGLELAADRPRSEWPDLRSHPGRSQPLDIPGLFAEVESDDGQSVPAVVAPGLRIGHVHLHVGDVGRGLAFYRDVLGFDEMSVIDTAAFVSAGGYHHHVGFNVWRPGQAAEGVVGLRDWAIELPEAADVDAVRERLERAGVAVTDGAAGFSSADPWGIPFSVRVPRRRGG